MNVTGGGGLNADDRCRNAAESSLDSAKCCMNKTNVLNTAEGGLDGDGKAMNAAERQSECHWK